MSTWQERLTDACKNDNQEYIAINLIPKMEQHLIAYPTFNIERLSRYIINSDTFRRSWYIKKTIAYVNDRCHRDISLTKLATGSRPSA